MTDPFIELYILDNYQNSFENYVPIRIQNKRNDIQMAKTVDAKLAAPYNPCQTIKDTTYRQDNCISLCMHQLTAVRYNCTMPGYYSIKLNKLCSDFVFNMIEKTIKSECENSCVKECETTTYNYVLSEVDHNFDEQIIVIEIRFADLTYLKITQTPKMSWTMLVSSIGGILSLFVGFKILSLVEFIEFLINISLAVRN